MLSGSRSPHLENRGCYETQEFCYRLCSSPKQSTSCDSNCSILGFVTASNREMWGTSEGNIPLTGTSRAHSCNSLQPACSLCFLVTSQVTLLTFSATSMARLGVALPV